MSRYMSQEQMTEAEMDVKIQKLLMLANDVAMNLLSEIESIRSYSSADSDLHQTVDKVTNLLELAMDKVSVSVPQDGDTTSSASTSSEDSGH